MRIGPPQPIDQHSIDRLRLLYGEALEAVGRITRAREQYAHVAARGRTHELRREARLREDRPAGQSRGSG